MNDISFIKVHIYLHYLLYYGTCILREKAPVYKIIALNTHTKSVYQSAWLSRPVVMLPLNYFLEKRTQSLKEEYPLTFKHMSTLLYYHSHRDILPSLLIYAINKPVIHI